jgi:hypothetical protein
MDHGNELKNKTLPGFPAGRVGVTTARLPVARARSPRWPVSGLTDNLHRLPRHLFQGAQWLMMKAEPMTVPSV